MTRHLSVALSLVLLSSIDLRAQLKFEKFLSGAKTNQIETVTAFKQAAERASTVEGAEAKIRAFVGAYREDDGVKELPIGFDKVPIVDGQAQEIANDPFYTDHTYLQNLAKLISPDATDGRIFGVDAMPVPASQFTECVAVGWNGTYYGTGVIIQNDIILTAAHLWDGDPETAPNYVWLGSVTPGNQESIFESGRPLKVMRYVRHEGYKHLLNNTGSPRACDILLLQLRPEARQYVTSTAPIAEPNVYERLGVDPLISVRAVGFGANRVLPNGQLDGFGVKRHVTIPLASEDVEKFGLSTIVVNGKEVAAQFVAASKAERVDTCKGDSGGPVYINEGGIWKVVGLTSRRTPGATKMCGKGAIYEKVGLYKQWIEQSIQHTSSWNLIID